MINKLRYLTAFSVAFLGFATTNTYACGFQILEQGASNLGTAVAGAGANANNDASAAYWNIASAVYSNLNIGETRIDISANLIIPSLSLDASESSNYLGESFGTIENCAPITPLPNMFVLHRFSEDFYGGLSVTVPYGLSTDYPESWGGRHMAITSYLMSIDFNPSICYKVNDWLSVGCGISAQYFYAKLTQDRPITNQRIRLTADSWSVGGNIGFAVNYAKDGRFAFAWRSSVSQELSGNGTMGNINAPVSTVIDTPHTFNISWYQRLWGKLSNFAVMADYTYTMWSLFENLDIKSPAFASYRYENWKDTSRISFGMHYYPDFNEKLVLRIGTAFDETPIRSYEYRTARIPCADRLWLTCGFGYVFNEKISMDFGYQYLFFIGNTNVDEVPTTPYANVKGHYFGNNQTVALQISLKF